MAVIELDPHWRCLPPDLGSTIIESAWGRGLDCSQHWRYREREPPRLALPVLLVSLLHCDLVISPAFHMTGMSFKAKDVRYVEHGDGSSGGLDGSRGDYWPYSYALNG